jgi:hypothetical protein
MPDITIVPDIFDAPYGLVKPVDKSGHSKPTHLSLNTTTVQSKGTLLALLALDPRLAGTAVTYATNVILPALADSILLDGSKKNLSVATSIATSVGTVITICNGKTAVAIRIVHADSLQSAAPAVVLQSDTTGLKNSAVRLTLYHTRTNTAAITQSMLKVGLMIAAEPCSTKAQRDSLTNRVRNMAITDSVAGKTWSVSAVLKGSTFEAGVNLTSRRPIYRTVDGQPMANNVFSVNGSDPASLVVPTPKTNHPTGVGRSVRLLMLDGPSGLNDQGAAFSGGNSRLFDLRGRERRGAGGDQMRGTLPNGVYVYEKR